MYIDTFFKLILFKIKNQVSDKYLYSLSGDHMIHVDEGFIKNKHFALCFLFLLWGKIVIKSPSHYATISVDVILWEIIAFKSFLGKQLKI